MTVNEITFQRAAVHWVHDRQRLEDGQDLNDALLDFFVKLGQSLIPEGLPAGSPAPVAYLGSHFYDVLRKGGVEDGRAGHKNVANWGKRRLGKTSLFADGVGAFAVPINEMLRESYDGKQQEEKHWWLALFLNPRGLGLPADGDDTDVSLLCLDSFVRAETRFDPPIKAFREDSKAYPVEVNTLSRVGFTVQLNFKAEGDGSAGSLSEPRKSRLRAGGREFKNIELNLKARDRGAEGRKGYLEGSLGFRLDRRGAAKTVGEYILEYGDTTDSYDPQIKLRMGHKPTNFQAQVATFLGGYLEKEREALFPASKASDKPGPATAEKAICLPGVPQQETSHDCGFFILEQILRCLQLTPAALRELAQASSVEIAMLPWPSQKQVFRRKAMLRDAVSDLFTAARKAGNGDVEVLLKADEGLKTKIREALREGGPSFMKGYERWAAGDWDLSPSPSRSRSPVRSKSAPVEKRSRSQETSQSSEKAKKKGKKRKKRQYSSSEESSYYRGRKRKNRDRSSSRSESESRGANAPTNTQPGKPQPASQPVQQQRYTQADLDSKSIAALKALCVHHAVLPAGIVERGDLTKALAPFVMPVVPRTSPTPSKVGIFTRADLDGMTSKALRDLCKQRGVLPTGAIERNEFLQALMPLAAPG